MAHADRPGQLRARREGLDEDLDMPDVGHDSLRLMTLRCNDQFNTTVYGYDDRFRGIKTPAKWC